MKIVKHIPNSITSLNLLSGCFAVILSFSGEFKAALFMIIASAIFDFCDGFAARILKAYSPMGKELDSLADVISFGLAPASIMFNKMLEIYTLEIGGVGSKLAQMPFAEAIGYLIPFLCALSIAIFSALRLAKFNIDTRQSENFIGLATPSCALIVGSLIYACESYPSVDEFLSANSYLLAIVSLVLSLLLVSEIEMFSFKFKTFTWSENKVRFSFLIFALLLAVVESIMMGGFPISVWIFTTFVSYIILNIALEFVAKR